MQFTSEHAIVRSINLFKYFRSIVSTPGFYYTGSKKIAWIKLPILIYFLINIGRMSKLRRYLLLRQIWKKNAIAIKANKDLIDCFFFLYADSH